MKQWLSSSSPTLVIIPRIHNEPQMLVKHIEILLGVKTHFDIRWDAFEVHEASDFGWVYHSLSELRLEVLGLDAC